MNRNQIYSLLTFLLLVGSYLTVRMIIISDEKKMYGNYKYGLATTFGFTYRANTGGHVSYEFVVSSRRYSHCESEYHNLKKKGGKYLVLFWVENPNRSELMNDFIFKDTTINVPKNGWDSIPFHLLQSYPDSIPEYSYKNKP